MLDENKAAQLGGTLRRIRIAEKPTDDGGKKVWHQGEGGVDLITFVDGHGRVTSQQLYADEVGISWDGTVRVLSTMVMVGERRDTGIAPSDQVVKDASPSPRTLALLHVLTTNALGEDRYITHMHQLITSAIDGLPDNEPVGEVTRSLTGALQVDEPGRTHPIWFLMVGLMVAAIGLGVAYIVFTVTPGVARNVALTNAWLDGGWDAGRR